jgi:hypothetical protein
VTIAMLKARFAAMPKLFPDKNGMLTIEDNKPVTFYVLIGEFSSKGMWYHPVGVSLGGQEADRCPEVAAAGPVESASEFARWRGKDCRNLTSSRFAAH